MGVAVASLLLLTNARELAAWAGASAWLWAIYSAILGVVALVLLASRGRSLPASQSPNAPAEPAAG